jgi:hypothetical protein
MELVTRETSFFSFDFLPLPHNAIIDGIAHKRS